MSSDRPAAPEISVDVDLDSNEAAVTVTETREVEIADLFHDGELRLWDGEAGWSGYMREETDDGPAYFYVDTIHGEDTWIEKVRVGKQAVRDSIKRHVADPAAGGVGTFRRRCSPP